MARARAELARRLARSGHGTSSRDESSVKAPGKDAGQAACVVVLHERPFSAGVGAEPPHGRLLDVATVVVENGDDLEAASEAYSLTNSVSRPWFEAASTSLRLTPASRHGCRPTSVGDALLVLRPDGAAAALSVESHGFARTDPAATLRRVQACGERRTPC